MTEDAASIFAELGLSTAGVLVLLLAALLFSSYVKIVTVLGMVRAGLGVGSLPGAFVTGGLAFALSLFVMYPHLRESAAAMDQSLRGKASVTDRDRADAINAGIDGWKKFVQLHAHPAEVERFKGIAIRLNEKLRKSRAISPPGDGQLGASPDPSGTWQVLAPAFVVSELQEAFRTGLSIFLPFLVVDLLVAVMLAALSLDRLNPLIVSFPFKVLLFVLVDGWTLITANLVSTYTN